MTRPLFGLALLVAALAFAPSAGAQQKPNYTGEAALQASNTDITVTIYNAPCQLTDHVKMPYRATWKEKGKTFEGCVEKYVLYGGQLSVYGFYFDDKQVSVIESQIFHKVKDL